MPTTFGAKSVIPLVALCMLVSGCAKPLRTEVVSFRLPTTYPSHIQLDDGLSLAIDPITTLSESENAFGTDIFSAGLFPVQVIVYNQGQNEHEIDATQMFAITSTGNYFAAYNLGQSAERVRESSLGTTIAQGAAAGAILGAIVGAGVGVAADDAGQGAASGAIIGAAAGGSAGASDSLTMEFKKQLGNLAFGNRVIYPTDIEQGFVYFAHQEYRYMRIKIFNISQNAQREIVLELRD